MSAAATVAMLVSVGGVIPAAKTVAVAVGDKKRVSSVVRAQFRSLRSGVPGNVYRDAFASVVISVMVTGVDAGDVTVSVYAGVTFGCGGGNGKGGCSSTPTEVCEPVGVECTPTEGQK